MSETDVKTPEDYAAGVEANIERAEAEVSRLRAELEAAIRVRDGWLLLRPRKRRERKAKATD